MASAFDGSAAISPLVSREGSVEDWCLVFRKNEEVFYSGRVEDLPLSPEQQIAAMSRYYMLKIGDFIYCGGLPRFVVQPGDRLRLSLADRELLDFGVK